MTMPQRQPSPCPWSDRFRTPDDADLMGGVHRFSRAAVRHAREVLTDEYSLNERILWYGVWRWSFVYERQESRHDRQRGQSKVAAYLIPDPVQPKMCIPIPAMISATLAQRSTPSFVRDQLGTCPTVDGVLWPVWSVDGKQMVSELLGTVLSR